MRPHLFHLISLAAIASLHAGCADAGDKGNWTGAVETLPSGTVVVSNPATGLWSADEAWRIEEVLRLGDLDGAGPAVFGRIGQIQVDRQGRIYIFDTQANELRIFDAEGHHVRTVGGSGAGPGEFSDVIAMDFSQTGEIWLVDAGNGRYTVLGPDGTLNSFRRPIAMYRLPWLGGFDEMGSFHDQATETLDSSTVDVLLRIGRDGAIADNFRLVSAELPIPRRGTMEFPLPFAPRLLRAWDPAPSIWQAMSSEYRIARIELSGDTSFVVGRAFQLRRLAPSQRDSVETYARNIEAEFGVTVPTGARPSGIAPLRWFAVDDEKYLWVCATGLDTCTELDLFDSEGRFLGTVLIPVSISNAPTPLIRSGYFYAAIESELGAPELFKGRTVRP